MCIRDSLNAILETLTDNGARTIMAQRYIPEIVKGDKRILLIGGEPVPYSLARIPLAGETRGNLAAGGRGVAQPLSPRDREIAEAVAPKLAARGLLLVGLDAVSYTHRDVYKRQLYDGAAVAVRAHPVLRCGLLLLRL